MDMSTFVAAAAHDMKNSVSVIAAYLEDALAQLGDDPGSRVGAAVSDDHPLSVRELTHHALYEAQRVNGHLIGIMAIYKIHQNIYPFEPEDVDLASLVDDLASRVRPLAATRGVTIETHVDPGCESGFFDRELVLCVVLQSLYGAIKYTHDHILLRLSGSGGATEIRVEDNGPGFPPYMLEQGFADRASIDSHTGSTGLGLYFSRLVAQLHRQGDQVGHTRLDNGGTLGGGCFVLYLP